MNNALHVHHALPLQLQLQQRDETRDKKLDGAESTPLPILIGYNPPRSGALLPDAHRSHLHVLSTSTFGLFLSITLQPVVFASLHPPEDYSHSG